MKDIGVNEIMAVFMMASFVLGFWFGALCGQAMGVSP